MRRLMAWIALIMTGITHPICSSRPITRIASPSPVAAHRESVQFVTVTPAGLRVWSRVRDLANAGAGVPGEHRESGQGAAYVQGWLST